MTNAQKQTRRFECEICNKKFFSCNDLRKHIRIHTDERPYSCNECGQAFRQAGSLKNHIACKHSPGLQSETIFICHFCKKVFPLKDRLKLHLRTHTGDKPYECDRCKKRFARGSQLSQHMLTHTGYKPYTCLICQSSFTCSANLKFHMNRHMEIRNFVCDICGKCFFRRDALKKHVNCYHNNVKAFHCHICKKNLKGHLPQHMRIHRQDKPHGCAHCGARFTQKSQLTVHQRTHSGERPYRCQICWKAFAHSTALRLHTRRHTGEKPFSCILCNASFSQLPHLKKHMSTIHKTNKPYGCSHCKTFHKSKIDLESHYLKCMILINNPKLQESKTAKISVDSIMPLEKMRYLVAILLKKISSTDRLKALGFNKRLIDEIVIDSIENSGREPCKDMSLSPAEKLKQNVQILLDWTVPKAFMDKFKQDRLSTEELLKKLTS